MSIGEACERSIRAVKISRVAHQEVSDYCNAYARKLLKDPSFEFHTLPDDIVETVFYGHGTRPDGGWSRYLKEAVSEELERMNRLGELDASKS